MVDACKWLPVLLRQSDGAASALADVEETLETAAHEEGLHDEHCQKFVVRDSTVEGRRFRSNKTYSVNDDSSEDGSRDSLGVLGWKLLVLTAVEDGDDTEDNDGEHGDDSADVI